MRTMPSAAEYRKQAEALYRRAKAKRSDEDDPLVLVMRAIELESLADDLERGQVQQSGTQPPVAPPGQQPAQQQQQAQPPKKGD
jgi:hypothetical protein